mmetsp:Transcript_73435/g.116782  ORF Transcript_73435/g.116782 Transcript_73435/m.116782 type:complete len:291 (-) Transcript_73435:331-1203(-)
MDLLPILHLSPSKLQGFVDFAHGQQGVGHAAGGPEGELVLGTEVDLSTLQNLFLQVQSLVMSAQVIQCYGQVVLRPKSVRMIRSHGLLAGFDQLLCHCQRFGIGTHIRQGLGQGTLGPQRMRMVGFEFLTSGLDHLPLQLEGLFMFAHATQSHGQVVLKPQRIGRISVATFFHHLLQELHSPNMLIQLAQGVRKATSCAQTTLEIVRLGTDGRNSFPMTHLLQMPPLMVQGVRQLALALQRPRAIGQNYAEDGVLNTVVELLRLEGLAVAVLVLQHHAPQDDAGQDLHAA